MTALPYLILVVVLRLCLIISIKITSSIFNMLVWISQAFIDICKKKYSNISFFNIDILQPNISLPSFDYIIMNGVFTEKIDLTFEQMFVYFCSMIEKIYPYCKQAMAFNLRSKQVELEDAKLFHLSLDELASWFLTNKFGRCFRIRND
ncbi:MAG: class I SAM-dependent methyltransferase [Candidatus Competibacteraceae bacterium]